MKRFSVIYGFELGGYLKNKIFVGVTLLLVAAIAVVTFIPNITALFSNGSEDSGVAEKPIMAVVVPSGVSREVVAKYFSRYFAEYDVRTYDGGVEEIKKDVVSGALECALVLDSLDSYVYYVGDLSMYDSSVSVAAEALREIRLAELMASHGISYDEAEAVIGSYPVGRAEALGNDQTQSFFYSYIMIFAFYMVIVIYGQFVATGVASEKSSRAMELLVTSTDTTSLIFAKVLAACTAGLIQLVAVFGSCIVFFRINGAALSDNSVLRLIFDIPVDLLIFMVLFFVPGFITYAFLYGASGSTVSKLEDANMASMPVTLIFVACFAIVVEAIVSGEVNGTLMVVCSYFPLTSPMAMYARICMTSVPLYAAAISLALLAVSTVAVGYFAAKVYRVGVLTYGTKPTPLSFFGSFFAANKREKTKKVKRRK